eukprot:gene15633-28951_t
MFAAKVNPSGMGGGSRNRRRMSFGLSAARPGITMDSIEEGGDGGGKKGCCTKASFWKRHVYSMGAIGLVVAYFLVGGLYYCFGPMKLKFVDFMYFAVSIMTTVGYGDLDINLTKGDK